MELKIGDVVRFIDNRIPELTGQLGKFVIVDNDLLIFLVPRGTDFNMANLWGHLWHKNISKYEVFQWDFHSLIKSDTYVILPGAEF